MCSNQLSYLAIFFVSTSSLSAGRIMLICPKFVNTFFAKKHLSWFVCRKNRLTGYFLIKTLLF
ncbi:hypothetical protein P20311_3440 [Pseudoalteromonas sp. BSi20311]|nr:hypothetical protein P20311_3440 [Pseudoalteromonas sp. BSi20311]